MSVRFEKPDEDNGDINFYDADQYIGLICCHQESETFPFLVVWNWGNYRQSARTEEAAKRIAEKAVLNERIEHAVSDAIWKEGEE